MLRHFFFPVAFALAGCDPGMVVQGTVADAHTAQRLGDATVVVRCDEKRRPDGDMVDVIETHADGGFRIARLGSMPPNCILEVRRDGYTTVQAKLGDICPVVPKNDRCWSDFSASYTFDVKLTQAAGDKP